MLPGDMLEQWLHSCTLTDPLHVVYYDGSSPLHLYDKGSSWMDSRQDAIPTMSWNSNFFSQKWETKQLPIGRDQIIVDWRAANNSLSAWLWLVLRSAWSRPSDLKKTNSFGEKFVISWLQWQHTALSSASHMLSLVLRKTFYNRANSDTETFTHTNQLSMSHIVTTYQGDKTS